MSDFEREYYEHFWKNRGGVLKGDPVLIDKVDRILRLVPDDVRTIVDIGCGDGAITNILAEQYETTAFDRSREALSHVRDGVRMVRGDATDLPFRDGEFDLSFSSELIEHTVEENLERVIREIERVAAKYVFLSVPNDEKLMKRNTMCSSCRHVFHLYLHYHSFDLKRLRRLLPGWRLIGTDVCGVPDKPTLNWVTVLKNRLAKDYFYVDGLNLICPSCGKAVESHRRTQAQRGISFALRVIEKAMVMLLGLKAKPDWLLSLFRREPGL